MAFDDEDFKDEIQAHLAIAAREKERDGLDPGDARYAALREFGNVTLTREAARQVWTPRWLDVLRDGVGDVRYAIRALAKHRAFSLTVIGVLALGIGVNAAVFTMLKGIALAPIAGVANSGQLAALYRETTAHRPVRVSYPDYQYLRDRNTAFKDLFGSAFTRVGLGRDRASRSLFAELVTSNYFHALGVNAQLGRTFVPADEIAPGRSPVAIISDGMWRRDFGGDPNILGQTIDVNSVPLTIVGVTDASFHGTIVSYDVEVFVPIMMAPQLGYTFGSSGTSPAEILADPRAAFFYPQGFLRSGVTHASASAESSVLWSATATERPVAEAGEQLRVVPFRQYPGSGQSILLPTLIVLSAMGLLVLAIACANTAGLVLVRGLSRRGEIAVRLALGASRGRIVRLLIVENLVLALPGAALGVLLAANGIPVLTSYAEWLAAPERLFLNLGVDRFVIGFATLAACGCALMVGFLPALQSARIDLISVINQDASPRGAPRGRFRAALVVAQVAVSLLLLVGAGLVTRSLDAARKADPGFQVEHVSMIDLDLKQHGYDETRGRAFYKRLLDEVRRDGAVESASLAGWPPANFLETRAQAVRMEGYDARRDEDLVFLTNAVTPDYFSTLRIPLRAGRTFQDSDDQTSSPVVIVNRTLADRYFGGAEQALGRRISVGGSEWRTVVGVAADIKYVRINESPRPYVYLPFLQQYRAVMTLHTRGSAPDDVLVEHARAAVMRLDPDLPILSAQPLSKQLTGSLLIFNVTATMLFVFGIAGMALAALGTYGLVAYTVRQSTHEIGIRMALGAGRASVVRAFLARGLQLGMLGAGFGIVGALAVGRFLEGSLFGVTATDGSSFARALAIVLAGVAAATMVPAWRASKTDPLTALRHQ